MGAQSSRLSREGVMNLPKLEMFGWAVLGFELADRRRIGQR